MVGVPEQGPVVAPVRPSRFYTFGWFFYLALAVGGAIWIGVREGGVALELFVNRSSWWVDVGVGTGTAGAMALAWEGAYRWLEAPRKLSELLAGMLGPLRTSEVLGLALLSGFAEELFFRGAVQGSFGLVWASLVFGLLHSGPGPAFRSWTLFATIAGLLLGGVMVWRHNLLAPVLAHVLFNALGLHRLSSLAHAVPRAADGGPGADDVGLD